MEGFQGRGAKRSGEEAALPERSSEGQGNPGALLVDSSGAPVAVGAEEKQCGEQQSRAAKKANGQCADAQSMPELAAVQQQQQQQQQQLQQNQAEATAEPMEVESARGTEVSANTEIVAIAPETGASGRYAKAEQTCEDHEKEESKKSFATLVKATCTSRSYPY
jgi:hypothetical protein